MTDQSVSLSDRAEQYIKIRDRIDEIKERHKEELAPFEEAKAKFEAFFLEQLNTLEVDNFKSKTGATVYKRIEVSATVADGEAFRHYVVENDAFDLADIRANKTAVREFVDAHGVQPPGVNYTTRYAIGCRRGKATKSE